MNDLLSKGDQEENIKNMYSRITDSDGHNFLDKVTGLCCALGNYCLIVFETTDNLFMRFLLQELSTHIGEKLFENAWVLHYTEEVPDKHFREFTVK